MYKSNIQCKCIMPEFSHVWTTLSQRTTWSWSWSTWCRRKWTTRATRSNLQCREAKEKYGEEAGRKGSGSSSLKLWMHKYVFSLKYCKLEIIKASLGAPAHHRRVCRLCTRSQEGRPATREELGASFFRNKESDCPGCTMAYAFMYNALYQNLIYTASAQHLI